MAAGERGEILSRGPDCCIGYTEPALTASAFDDDGWFRTGDIGTLDDDGWLSIVDRKKDVIIRGGENISALEVEEALLRMEQELAHVRENLRTRALEVEFQKAAALRKARS